MERQQILAPWVSSSLHGMRAAFDEVIKAAVKRWHEPQKIVSDLLSAEIAEKQARLSVLLGESDRVWGPG